MTTVIQSMTLGQLNAWIDASFDVRKGVPRAYTWFHPDSFDQWSPTLDVETDPEPPADYVVCHYRILAMGVKAPTGRDVEHVMVEWMYHALCTIRDNSGVQRPVLFVRAPLEIKTELDDTSDQTKSRIYCRLGAPQSESTIAGWAWGEGLPYTYMQAPPEVEAPPVPVPTFVPALPVIEGNAPHFPMGTEAVKIEGAA